MPHLSTEARSLPSPFLLWRINGLFLFLFPWSPFLLTLPLPACCLLPRLPAEWPLSSFSASPSEPASFPSPSCKRCTHPFPTCSPQGHDHPCS